MMNARNIIPIAHLMDTFVLIVNYVLMPVFKRHAIQMSMVLNVNGFPKVPIAPISLAAPRQITILLKGIASNIILKVIALPDWEEAAFRNRLVKMHNCKLLVQHLLIINYVFGIHSNAENKFVMTFLGHLNKNVHSKIVPSRIHLYMALSVQPRRNVQNFILKICAQKVLMASANGLITLVISIQVVILYQVNMMKFVNPYQKIVQLMATNAWD